MSLQIPEILLWLFVINHGIAFGAGLYEQRIVVPQWMGQTSNRGVYVNAGAMHEADTGRRFWGFVTTGPLTLLTLANLAVAWHSQGPAHPWWLGSVLITLVERFGTFAYFIPAAIRLMHAVEPLTPKIKATALRWVALNRLRIAFSLLGWVGALRALSLQH
jgi:hypothetical protein